VRLVDLDPRWIYKSKVFAFLCPHCRTTWLTCKRVVMEQSQQRDIIESAFGENVGYTVVGCKPAVAWKFGSLDFETMSVTPSLDASASGHWHGHITKGMIMGGVQA
jgi:hypothetical protein